MPRSRKAQPVWAGVLPDGRTLAIARAKTAVDASEKLHNGPWTEVLHSLEEDGKPLWPYPPKAPLDIRAATELEENFWLKAWNEAEDVDEDDYNGFVCWPIGQEP